jgi:hypothetical protein
MFFTFGLLSPPEASGQEGGPAPREFRLEQAEHDPGNRGIWIPFVLDPTLFSATDTAVVTVQIFNVLAQQVAVPRAINFTPGQSPAATGLVYREPGRKRTFWNAQDGRGRAVPAGVYYCKLTVNDEQPLLQKIIVTAPRRRPRLIPWFGRN